MDRNRNDPSRVRVDELAMAALARSGFDEPGRLEPTNQFAPRHRLSIVEPNVWFFFSPIDHFDPVSGDFKGLQNLVALTGSVDDEVDDRVVQRMTMVRSVSIVSRWRADKADDCALL